MGEKGIMMAIPADPNRCMNANYLLLGAPSQEYCSRPLQLDAPSVDNSVHILKGAPLFQLRAKVRSVVYYWVISHTIVPRTSYIGERKVSMAPCHGKICERNGRMRGRGEMILSQLTITPERKRLQNEVEKNERK